MTEPRIIVVGAGPAGMMAGIRAGALSRDVALLEKNAAPGSKLLLTGNGRCNLTNACELDGFFGKFSHDGQFLRDAFKKFFNKDLVRFFETRGLPLKTEAQGRVFPGTDRADSVLAVLERELVASGVKVLKRVEVRGVSVSGRAVTGVRTGSGGEVPADRVILAAGGASYPSTGSDGGGYRIAGELGHTIVPPRPGLVPLTVPEGVVRDLEGLSLENVHIRFLADGKEFADGTGDLLFTASGISGPLVLALSGRVSGRLAAGGSIRALVDFAPGTTAEKLDAGLQRDLGLNPRKALRTLMKGLLPQRLADYLIASAGIDGQKQCAVVSREERRRLAGLVGKFQLEITGTMPLEQAMVTCGGVSLKEVDPRTMQSRKIDGLYFCGEMLDLDAETGGFNLQAAFSTGYLAGESAASSR